MTTSSSTTATVNTINTTNASSLPSDYTNEINALNRSVAQEKPADILQFCANFFHRRLEAQRAEFLLAAHRTPHGAMESSFPGSNPFSTAASTPSALGQGKSGTANTIREEDEMDAVTSPTATESGKGEGASGSPFGSFGFGASFNPSGASDALPANYALGRRTSVSAESMNPNASASDNWTPPHHPKTPEQLARIKAAVAANFLFSHLDEDQTALVLSALFEKQIPAKGIKVIAQGDAGDNFYVVERGAFAVHIHASGAVQPGPEGTGPQVGTIGPGGSFGELALMYNAPRAATIVSTEANSLLWALDRLTFRRILMDAAFQRRRMYEAFLDEVPLLAPLTPYERAKIADALESRRFPRDAVIIREGDVGDAFYLLESGAAVVYRRDSGDRVVHRYKKGDYFGELALLDDKPRAASVAATEDVKVATLGKEGFLRLLGPVEERMRELDPSKRKVEEEPARPQHVAGGSEGVDPLTA